MLGTLRSLRTGAQPLLQADLVNVNQLLRSSSEVAQQSLLSCSEVAALLDWTANTARRCVLFLQWRQVDCSLDLN